MVELIPPPDPHVLIPPLLACLPTSFASPRPPPALISLLSPILRQRVQLHSSTSPSSHEGWLPLLCWDRTKASVLKERVKNTHFEPHPVSGEIEVGDIAGIKYKRFDEETLRAQILLSDWPLTALYLWCTGGDEGSAWRLAELLPSDTDLARDRTWSDSIGDANDSSRERLVTEALREAEAADVTNAARKLTVLGDDDDYWAMYDKTPGRTPARKHSVDMSGSGGATEADYYARYSSVQPAMDNHDPDEEMADDRGAESTATVNGGTALHPFLSRPTEQPTERSPPPYQEPFGAELDEKGVEVSQPVPSSPSSRGGSDAVARLEQSAERYGASEIAIRQHISTTMKSMYRLAKSAGMDREEFDRIVQRELETLSILDRDD